MLAVLRTGVEENISEGIVSVTAEFWDATKSYAFQSVADTDLFGVQRRMPANRKEFHPTVVGFIFEVRLQKARSCLPKNEHDFLNISLGRKQLVRQRPVKQSTVHGPNLHT